MSSIDIIDMTKLYIQFTEESLEKHDKQIRADALNECLNIVRTNGYQVSLIMIKGLLEQLKEQTE